MAELWRAGSELVRITVNSPEAAAQVAGIRARLDAMGCDVPLIGDFHFNGHKLLTQFPDCARALAKYRINPGNVGKGAKRDEQFATMIEAAIRYGKPVRIGVNWGSLDQALLARLMDENARRAAPLDAAEVMREAVIRSALESAQQAEDWGLPAERIVISCKMSGVQDLIAVYRAARAALRLRAAPRAHRGRHGLQGHRRLERGDGGAAAGGHRRHDPRLAHPRAGRRSHARSGGGAGDPADHGHPLVHADGRRLPGLRAHHQHAVPGARGAASRPTCARRCRCGASAIPASRRCAWR